MCARPGTPLGGILEKSRKRNDGIIKVIRAERFTPYALARKLDAKVILESSSFKKGRERYSLLLIREAFRVSQSDGKIFLTADAKTDDVTGPRKDILDVLLDFSEQHPPLHQDLPFPAGGIGYLSYEFASGCDTIHLVPKPDPLGLPDSVFLFGHIFIVFDHYTDILYIIGLNYEGFEIDLEKAIDETEARINDLDFNYLAQQTKIYEAKLIEENEGRDRFLRGVEKIREEIIRGNLLQGVLSRRLCVQTELPALEAYKNLRSSNPSPYLFYIDFGDFQLFGASPEVHVKVKDGKATLRPIAGTRRRGSDAVEDGFLEEELRSDEKEVAEHLMLVDLARNDLGRFCIPGTIRVSEYLGIEYYSHVMHLVSQTDGDVASGASGADAIRATFPAGTVSGAPKIRAVETVDRLEPHKRSFYAGLVGYLGPDGDLDTCITIRSAVKKEGIIYLQAGAGIVYDSAPKRELEETEEKLRALVTAVGVEV